MYNHATADYVCPICIAVEGRENSDTLIAQSDIVYKDDLATAFISSFFIGNNPGHVIIVPNEHFENIYDLPTDYSSRISDLAQRIALAMRESYPTEGITTLQNNEPAGNQHAFHYHFHVFPRYENDNLHANMMRKIPTTPQNRLPFADKLKEALSNQVYE